MGACRCIPIARGKIVTEPRTHGAVIFKSELSIESAVVASVCRFDDTIWRRPFCRSCGSANAIPVKQRE